MEITIIGAGNMARGIATRALAGGHAVTLLGEDAEQANALAGELPGEVGTGVTGDLLAGEVVVLAVPYTAVGEVLAQYSGRLGDKVVVEISNPIDFSTMTPLVIEAGSAAQEAAQNAPGAKVVKAFNTTFARTLVAGTVAGQPLDVFIASDHADAKASVRDLVEDGGMRALDAGSLARARELEALGYLHIALQHQLGTGFGSAVKIIS
jgi:predicted dinucleotide-binding enzyme